MSLVNHIINNQILGITPNKIVIAKKTLQTRGTSTLSIPAYDSGELVEQDSVVMSKSG